MMKKINNKVKAVTVGGWMKDGVPQTISLIGAFDNMAEAFGEAYLYLNDYCLEENEITITPVQDLEEETGYVIYGKDERNQIRYYAYILYNHKQEDEMNG